MKSNNVEERVVGDVDKDEPEGGDNSELDEHNDNDNYTEKITDGNNSVEDIHQAAAKKPDMTIVTRQVQKTVHITVIRMIKEIF